MPIDRSEDHWNNARLAGLMPIHRACHLAAPAVIGRDEVGANQKQNDLGRFEDIIDGGPDLAARSDLSIMPRANGTLPLEGLEMLNELIMERLVSVRIGHENRQRAVVNCEGHTPILPDPEQLESCLGLCLHR